MKKFIASSLKKLTKTLTRKSFELEKEKSNNKKTTERSEHKKIEEIDKEVELSRQKRMLISVAGEIRLDPDKTEAAFIARQLVQATLPHKNPGNVESWSRKNGDLILGIRPGWDHTKDKSIGYPYGTIPRLLLFWITTEAIRTKSPRLELGHSLSEFMKTLGLNTDNGSGKRSDTRRLHDQMMRLFQSSISFTQLSGGKFTWLNMQVAPKGALWWDEKKPRQGTIFENWIQLGEDFFKAIIASPVPVDMRVLKALKRSPLALDMYSWATYTAYQTQKTGEARSLSWELLHEQFGSEYGDIKDFSKKAWQAILKIKIVYPELNIERIYGGIKILPSKPSITMQKRKNKKVMMCA